MLDLNDAHVTTFKIIYAHQWEYCDEQSSPNLVDEEELVVVGDLI